MSEIKNIMDGGHITININLSDKDRESMERLSELMTRLLAVYTGEGAPVKEEAPAPEPIALEPVQEELPPEFKEEVKVEPPISLDELRAKVMEMASKGRKADVRAIINDYAEKVTAVPEDKRREAYERICALEA